MWTEESGVVRYTSHPERVPGSARASLVPVLPGMPAQAVALPEPPELPVPAPGSLAGPGGAAAGFGVAPTLGAALPRSEADPFSAPDPSRGLEEVPIAPPEPDPAASHSAPAETPAASGSAPDETPAASTPGVESGPPAQTREPPVATAASAATPAQLDARIAELRASIARDEQALQALISAERDSPLRDSPELRELARRLPADQAELAALEARRGSGE
jgi:hypothetical protein